MTSTDDDATENAISKEDWAKRRLEEVQLGATTNPIKGFKQSMGNYRRLLQLDNMLVFLINVVFLGIGGAFVLESTVQWMNWIGYLCLFIGGLGVVDAAAGRLWMWLT